MMSPFLVSLLLFLLCTSVIIVIGVGLLVTEGALDALMAGVLIIEYLLMHTKFPLNRKATRSDISVLIT